MNDDKRDERDAVRGRPGKRSVEDRQNAVLELRVRWKIASVWLLGLAIVAASAVVVRVRPKPMFDVPTSGGEPLADLGEWVRFSW